MGLSSHLSDISGDSIPVLLVAAAAGWVSYLRSLLLCLLHSFGLHHHHGQGDAAGVGSSLAGLMVLAEQLSGAQRAFSYGREEVEDGVRRCLGGAEPECVVCLGGMSEGERVRRLSCCRQLFHSECLDGWFDQSKLSCPLCRSPLVLEERRADVERRISAELVDWLAPY